MYNYYFRANRTYSSIFSYARGDVNGDGIPDNVYLTGIKTPDSPFTQNITLVIQDGMMGGFTSIPLSENAGYNPTLFLGDFTGDGVKDILIGINTGGSGGIMYYYIILLLTILHNYCLTLIYITRSINMRLLMKTIIRLK